MTDNIREVFSKNLKQILKNQGKTQLELAEFVGVSDASVNNWVNGIKLPRMDKVDNICQLLNVKRSELIEAIEQQTKEKTIEDIDFTGIDRIAAHYRGEEFSEEALDAIQDFVEYVRSKNKKKQG